MIILDEPTSALDLTNQLEILNVLKHLQEELKLTYIFISHDLRVVRAISHHILVMKDGKIVEDGSTDKIFTDPQSEYTKTLISSALNIR